MIESTPRAGDHGFVPSLRSRGPRTPVERVGGWFFNMFRRGRAVPSEVQAPAIYHVTHWKAGSQWLHKIFLTCRPDLVVPPQAYFHLTLQQPVKPGGIYPTVYVTHEQFQQMPLPSEWRRFVVIRDLRDTLISVYYSLKKSHAIMDDTMAEYRARLNSSSVEDGLLFLMNVWLYACAKIQQSWLDVGEPLIHYEHLLERDLEILEPLLLDECRLPVERERFREVVRANRFENLTGGRARGQEDSASHERKGIAGDWRGHFSDRLKGEFKERFGELLIATGYEKNSNW